MARATAGRALPRSDGRVNQVRIALVCPNDRLRMAAASAFDAAPPDWEVTLHRDPPSDADALVAVGCEIPDAIPFDPTQAALIVERVKERLATSGSKLVAVVGASGGCGATTLAIHLAAASKGACLVVAGSPAGIAHRLGLAPEMVSPTPAPVPGGFRVACAGEAELGAMTEGLAHRFASIVVDGGRAPISSVIDRSDACVLVLSPTVPSARIAAGVLDAFPDHPWAVVTNRLGPGGETGSAELQRILRRRITLQLPCSRALRDAEGEGRLVPSWVPWRRRVDRLARALELR